MNNNIYKIEGMTNGSAYLIHFWSKSCPVCHDNILKVQNIRDLYRGKGLIVIAIHRPMGPYDLDIDSVNQVRDQIGITEKCIFDNDHSIGDSLGVIAWPTYFLFDSECKLRRHAKGQLGIRMIEQSLIRMFSESS